MGYVTTKYFNDVLAGKHDEDEMERLEMFYQYLQGNVPDEVGCKSPKLTSKKAYEIIWFLQEISHFIPDKYERCDTCGDLFNAEAEGNHCEKYYKTHCGSCAYTNCKFYNCEECLTDYKRRSKAAIKGHEKCRVGK
jgi:hypothetical protein